MTLPFFYLLVNKPCITVMNKDHLSSSPGIQWSRSARLLALHVVVLARVGLGHHPLVDPVVALAGVLVRIFCLLRSMVLCSATEMSLLLLQVSVGQDRNAQSHIIHINGD